MKFYLRLRAWKKNLGLNFLMAQIPQHQRVDIEKSETNQKMIESLKRKASEIYEKQRSIVANFGDLRNRSAISSFGFDFTIQSDK